MRIAKHLLFLVFSAWMLFQLSTHLRDNEQLPNQTPSAQEHTPAVSSDGSPYIKHKENHHTQYFSIVDEENYQQFWDRGTFPTTKASIAYHTKKHGFGRSAVKYTADAVNFYERNQGLRYSTVLKNGSLGYRIRKGQRGGIWTKEGKILTYWD